MFVCHKIPSSSSSNYGGLLWITHSISISSNLNLSLLTLSLFSTTSHTHTHEREKILFFMISVRLQIIGKWFNISFLRCRERLNKAERSNQSDGRKGTHRQFFARSITLWLTTGTGISVTGMIYFIHNSPSKYSLTHFTSNCLHSIFTDERILLPFLIFCKCFGIPSYFPVLKII
jgi:hypothetical protein